MTDRTDRAVPLDPTTRLAPTIDAFHPADWSRIARGRSLYTSHPYLTYSERHHPDRAWYLTCTRAGHLAAALPAYEITRPDDDLDAYDYHDQFARLPGLVQADRTPWYPGLLGGTRSGYVTDLLTDPALAPAQRCQAVRQLLTGLHDLADSRGARSTALLYLTSDAAAVLADPRTGGPGGDRPGPLLLSPFGVDTWLPLPYASFEEYVQHLSSGRRHAVRREIARFRAHGLRVEVVRLGEHHERLGPLLANVQRKYGHRSTDADMTRLLGHYAHVLDVHSRVFLGRGPTGDLLGYALFFAWDNVLYARNVGFAYDKLPADISTYVNLLFYAPIAYAIEHRCTAVHLGMGSPAKAARGARIRPLWSLLLPPREARSPTPEQVAEWNERCRRRWFAEYGRFGAQLRPQEWA